jgi:hypothetical protein
LITRDFGVTLERFVAVCKEDTRVVAAFLGGSRWPSGWIPPTYSPATRHQQGIAYPADLEAVVIDKLERWGAVHLER